MVGTFSLINIQWQSFQSFNNEWAFNCKWVWKIWMFWDLTICRQFGWLCSMCQLHFHCEDAKEDIESTKGLFWMGPFDGEYPYKRKTYASDSKLNKQCPFLKNNNFLSALWEILSEVYLWVSISCFSEKKFKAFLPI